MKTTEWVLLDTETSGLSQPVYCVEIAAQRMRGLIVDGAPFRAFLNHNVDIEPQAEALHGYSRKFLREHGKNPAKVHCDFFAYAGERPVVAYNLSFDWARVLEPELQRLNLKPTYRPGFCAMTLARRCVYETDGHKLETLRSYFFPQLPSVTHHAIDDVEVTNKIFLEVIWPRLERAGIDSFSAVAEFSRKTPVRECLYRVRNPQSPSKPAALTALEPESELKGTIECMLADGKIVDAEVWALKHWLDTHADHQSELAERSRRMLKVALEDGDLSNWELDEIRNQLGRLISYSGDRPSTEVSNEGPSMSTTDANIEKKRRVSLTKRQLEEEIGAALLNLLTRIVADGKITDGEIEELTNWLLENQSADLPAVGHLLDVVKDVLADGEISDSERVDLFVGIEKVLPVTDRRVAKTARERADQTAFDPIPKIGREDLRAMAASDVAPLAAWSGNWRSDAMTQAQSNFIRSLGGSISASATKGEASDLINTLMGKKPITNRQQMVMRFWARDRQPGDGPREISEWMDQFYQDDPNRKLAWELFKNESEDNGLQGDPNRVPLGAGPKYLARVKEGGEAAIPKFRTPAATFGRAGSLPAPLPPKRSSNKGVIIGVIATATIAFAVFSFVRSPSKPPRNPPTAKPTEASAAVETPTSPPPTQSTQSPPKAAANPNAMFVRQLKITGIIGGARQKATIEGKLLGVGDVVDASRGILVYSIDAETRTIAFIDLAGDIHKRTLN